MSWSEKDIALLKKLWQEGKSAREIAEQLGNGVTRNAVIGKVNRMKLGSRKAAPAPERNTPSRSAKPSRAAAAPAAAAASKKAEASPGRAAAPRPAKPEASEVVEALEETAGDVSGAEPLQGSLFGEGGGCKWPINHPGEEDFHFCGQKRQTGFPYCGEHAKEAYQMVDKRRGGRSS